MNLILNILVCSDFVFFMYNFTLHYAGDWALGRHSKQHIKNSVYKIIILPFL